MGVLSGGILSNEEAPPVGTAGGDLSGTYPNPSVASIGGKTVTLGGSITTAGNFILSGAYALTLTMTATTGVTLPTSGTLATLAGSETFTNKTLTSPVISGGTIDNAAIGGTTPAAGAFTTLSASSGGTLTGSGSSSAADSSNMPLILTGGGSPTAGNLYGLAILKSGSEELFLGINKNSATGSVPASAVYLSTYTSTGKISIGRGNGAGTLNKQDIGVTSAGSILLGTPSVATNATDGFVYIPSNAGAPSGTATSQSGQTAMYYDTTNHKIWFYDGGWKGVVVS